jgi:hypothetical protein
VSRDDLEIVAEEDADVMDPAYVLWISRQVLKVDGDVEEESARDAPVDRRNLWCTMKGVAAKVECRVSHVLSHEIFDAF